MSADLTVSEMQARGAAIPASEPMRELYRDTFRRYGLHALWSSRPVADPTVADLLAITESLRVEGGIAGRRRALEIVSACRAAF